MIDCISGGRLIAGMVVGGGPEYYSFSINPAHARERFAEAHDLIIKAWTEPGPFEFIGKHYKFRYVNTWPRPVQKPHPEVWIPGAGSLETLEFVARAPLRLHGHSLLPHRRVRPHVRHAQAGMRARGLRGRAPCSWDGWYRSSSPRQTQKPASVTKSISGTSCAGSCPGINISPPGYTSVNSVENIIKGCGHVRAQPRDLGAGDRRPLCDRGLARDCRPRCSARTSTDSESGTCSGCSSSARFLPTTPGAISSSSRPRLCRSCAHSLRTAAIEQAVGQSRRAGAERSRRAYDAWIPADCGRCRSRSTEGGGGGPAPLVYLHSANGEAAGTSIPRPPWPRPGGSSPRSFPDSGPRRGIEHIEDIEDAAFHLLDLLDRLDMPEADLAGMSLGDGWRRNWPCVGPSGSGAWSS